MASLKQLYVALSLRAETYNNGLREARRQTEEFQRNIRPTLRVVDELSTAMKKAGVAMTAAVTAPIVAVAGLGIQFNAMQEQAQIAFTTMLGSGEKARVFLEDLKNFAAKTPFEFPDLVKASQRLIAMGFAAEKVKPLLTSVGDAAAGLGGGADVIDRVTLALGQMQGRGKIATQEMNQLTEAGIPAWKMLAEGMGVAESKIRDMVEKGLVPAGPAIDILQKGMDKAFGGMMARQAETFSGLLSTIKDDARFIAGDLTQGLFDLLKGPMKSLVETLEGLRGTVAGLSSETKGWLAIFAGGLATVGPLLLGVSFTMSTLVSGWQATKTAYIALAGSLQSLEIGARLAGGAFAGFSAVLSVAAIAAATFAIYEMYKAFKDLLQAWDDLKKAQDLQKTAASNSAESLRRWGIDIQTQGKSVREIEAAVTIYGMSLQRITKLEGEARQAAIAGLGSKVATAQELARLIEDIDKKISDASFNQEGQPIAVSRTLTDERKRLQGEFDWLMEQAKNTERAMNAVKTSVAAATNAPVELSKELQALGDHFHTSLRPADELNAEMMKLKQVFGASNADLVSVYGDRILKSSEAQRAHGFATTGLIANLEPLAYALDYNAKKYEEMTKAAEDAAKKEEELGKRKQEQIVQTTEDYWRQVRPADALNERLQSYIDIGATAADIAQVFGKDILAAAEQQRKHGDVVTGLVAKLEGLARAFQGVSDVAKIEFSMIDRWSESAKLVASGIENARKELEKVKIPQQEPNPFQMIPPAPPEARFNQMAQSGIDRIRHAREEADKLEKAVRQLTAAGLTDSEMIFSLGSDLDAAATASREFGFQLEKPTQRLIDITESTKRSALEAQQWQKVWEQVMANIVVNFSNGITDVIFRARSLKGALADIGKTTGRAFIQAFFAELFNPLTQMLMSWGKQLASTLRTQIIPKIAGAIGLGKFFPATAKAAGTAAGAGGSGAAAAGGGAAGGGGMFGISGSTLGFAGLAGLAAFGGFKLGGWINDTFFGGAEKKAHKRFVEDIQNPFYSGLGQTLQQFRSQRDSGTLTTATGQAYLQDLTGLVRGFTSTALQFASQGKSQGKEVQTAFDAMRGLYGDNFRKVFDEVNRGIAGVKSTGGVGLPQTGLALSASTKFSDAVDRLIARLVPALEGFGDLAFAGAGTINAPFAPVYNVNITASSKSTREIMDELDDYLEGDIGGYRSRWGKWFRSGKGQVDSQ